MVTWVLENFDSFVQVFFWGYIGFKLTVFCCLVLWAGKGLW